MGSWGIPAKDERHGIPRVKMIPESERGGNNILGVHAHVYLSPCAEVPTISAKRI